jgi:thiamine kinase-like enzyme
MEYLEFPALTEADVHASSKNATATLQAVATSLAKLHSLPIIGNSSTAKKTNNMLWSSLEVLLSIIEDGEQEDHHLGCYYRQQVEWQKDQLEALDLPIVFGHGDFKPSNVIVEHHHDDDDDDCKATFIDFEMVGCHYRAFDLAKWFRTSNHPPTPWTRRNRQAFFRQYLRQSSGDTTISTTTTHLLQLESQLLLPMTWLEAAIFFEASSSSSSSSQKNDLRRTELKQLAHDRKQQYQDSCKTFLDDVRVYQEAKRA